MNATTTLTARPGFDWGTRRAISRSSNSGAATLLMIQPDLNSSLVLTGYDLDNDGNLTTYGTDRTTSTRSYYLNENGAWWQVTERKTHDSPGTAITTSTSERLNGNTGNLASSTLETLPGGGTIRTETALNRASKSRIQTATRSGYVRPEITVDINGLSMAHWAPDATKPTRRTFDALGRVLTETTHEGATTTTIWGTDGKISSVTDHLGNTTTYTWHGPTTTAAGRLDTVTNPVVPPNSVGTTTIRTWSTRGELLTVSGTAQYPVTYTYDDYGDRYTMTTWRDTNNTSGTSATTTWNHDPASGVLLNKTYQGGNQTTYTWYATGKPLTRTWQRGATTTWIWNSCGDLTAINYTSDNGLAHNVAITALDCLGRPLTVTQAGIGTEHFTWQTGTGAAVGHSYESGHSLLPGKSITWSAPDPHGLPTGYTASDVGTVAYAWLDGQLQNITSGTSAFGYDYFGETNLVRHMTAWDSGTAEFLQTRSYDISGRLLAASSASLATGNQPVSRHGYQFDSLGRRTTTIQLDGSTWTWGYDDRSEVTSSHRFERVPNQNGPVEVTPFAETYAFDDIGNRTSSTSPILGDFNYTANALNQYATIATGNANSNPTRAVVGTAPAGDVTINNAITPATRINSIFFGNASASYSSDPLWLDASVVWTHENDTQTLARSMFVPAPSVSPIFDDDGNLVNDGRWTYVWDTENRLVQMETIANTETTAIPPAISHPHRKLTFAYDWTGHRLSRKVFGPSDALISDTRWLWDGWNPVAEYSGTTLTNTYIWGLDLSGTLQGAGGVGGLLAVTTHGSPSATYYPSFDGNGNITAWTKSGEAHATCLREYDAFGNVLAEQGTPPCGFGFSTKMEDPETGLVYYDLRYLQPLTGRWSSVDPIGEEGGINLNGFVTNDGVNGWDSLGMWKDLKRKSDKEWATICAEEGDTWPGLANTLKLESQDAQKWVNNYETTPKGGTLYQIPNVAVFFSNSSWNQANFAIYAVTLQLLNMARYDSDQGYKTDWVNSDDPDEFKRKWKVDGIYKFYFAGHGTPVVKKTWYHRDIILYWEGLLIDETHADSNPHGVVRSSQVAPKPKKENEKRG